MADDQGILESQFTGTIHPMDFTITDFNPNFIPQCSNLWTCNSEISYHGQFFWMLYHQESKENHYCIQFSFSLQKQSEIMIIMSKQSKWKIIHVSYKHQITAMSSKLAMLTKHFWVLHYYIVTKETLLAVFFQEKVCLERWVICSPSGSSLGCLAKFQASSAVFVAQPKSSWGWQPSKFHVLTLCWSDS